MTVMDSGLPGDANPGEGDQQGSANNSESEGLSDVLKRLAVVEQQNKALQSEKDRGVNQVRKDNTAIKEDLATFRQYIEKFGDEAEWRYNVDVQLQSLQTGQTTEEAGSPANDPAGQGAGAKPESADVLTTLGVDRQGQEYLAEVGKGFTAETAALNVLAARAASVGDPNAASGIAGGGGTGGISAPAQAILADQREKELDTKPFWSPWELQQLNVKYQKLGLPVE